MEKKGWRAIALLFMILFVMETVSLILFTVEGTKIVERENQCAYNICGDDPDIFYYEYFPYEEICECYDIGMNVVKQEYLG